MYPNLKLHLWRYGIRQNRLARILNLDETALSRIINGFRKPCPALQAKIAAALGSDPDWLFEEVHPEPLKSSESASAVSDSH